MRTSPTLTSTRIRIILVLLPLAFLAGCSGFGPPSPTPVPKHVVVRFAIIGDAEPKPHPDFPYLSLAVDAINDINRREEIDFVAGIGDIAHRGELSQYEAATEQLLRLDPPFLTIMGNEEYDGGVDRFLEYAALWNGMPNVTPKPSFVYVHRGINFVFASGSKHGRDFSNADIDWLNEAFHSNPAGPIFLFTHAPAPSVFPDVAADRTIQNHRFKEILSHERLAVVFSGHLHMNINLREYYRTIDGILHIHVPGLERTKVPDGAVHEPYFYLVTIFDDGEVLVEMYALDASAFDERHRVTFYLEL